MTSIEVKSKEYTGQRMNALLRDVLLLPSNLKGDFLVRLFDGLGISLIEIAVIVAAVSMFLTS